jgi:hypothetical protein
VRAAGGEEENHLRLERLEFMVILPPKSSHAPGLRKVAGVPFQSARR